MSGVMIERRIESVHSRSTRHYVPYYKHCDDNELLSDIRVTYGAIVNDDGAFDSSGYQNVVIAVLCEVSDSSKMRDALHDHFQWSCACERDCCGHVSVNLLKLKQKKANLWVGKLRYSPNY